MIAGAEMSRSSAAVRTWDGDRHPKCNPLVPGAPPTVTAHPGQGSGIVILTAGEARRSHLRIFGGLRCAGPQ